MSTVDSPLGVANLKWDGKYLSRPVLPEHWYWCRRHEQAHKVGENCREQLGGPGGGSIAWRMPFNDDCIDVGPFMSEDEALRLDRMHGIWLDGSGRTIRGPLGVTIERLEE